MRIGLCMIVKDEAHIIHESLNATLPLIDTYCIVDTGSSDNTIQKIRDFYSDKGISGEVHERPWKNFGHNRSEALKLCDGKMDYILVIDADDLMGFPSNGKKILTSLLEKESPNGVQIIIKQQTIEYWRSQIFKANDDWKYIGVLHEYPSNGKPNCKQIKLPLEFWMESRRLGGRNRQGNKMERDIAVLTKGLEDEPDNERYMFYLAQSYKDNGNFEQALKYYKKRFKVGKWAEEAWYSAYRVGECYKMLKNIPKFEYWMQKAHMFRPWRAEPIYQLTEFFRVNSQLHKAYHYAEIGRKIGYPKDDVLFVEKFPHEGGFDYECSILDYYIHSDKKVGLRDSINYLLKRGDHINNVVANMKFYITPISSRIEPTFIKSPFPPEFHPSAISVLNYPYANSRFVNYEIQPNGSYKTPQGIVITRNAYINLETWEAVPMEDPTPVFESEIRGIEDLRLYEVDGKKYFTATSYKQYIKDQVSIVAGEYNLETKKLENARGIQSPTNSTCEKNWVHIPGNSHEFIYSWHPLRIGELKDSKLEITKTIQTPPLFSLFRGSACPMKYGDKWWCLVHFVEYCVPRKYYHCFVELDSSWNPLRVTLPFYFKNNAIEYCISTRFEGDTIQCFVSFNDCNPANVHINIKDLEWIQINTYIPPKIKTTFVTALFDLDEPRPETKTIDKYFEYFKELVNSDISLHVFVNTKILDKFNKVFSHYSNVHVQCIELSDLEVYRQIQDLEFDIPKVRNTIKDTKQFMIIMNSKAELVHIASEKNIFNTEQFAWIDFGIGHVIKNKNNYTSLSTMFANDKLIVPYIWSRDKERAGDFNTVNWRFAGGFFIGKKRSVDELYALYKTHFRDIVKNTKILSWEVNVWAYFEEFYNWNPATYKANHTDEIILNHI